jgi:hypothetical protein
VKGESIALGTLSPTMPRLTAATGQVTVDCPSARSCGIERMPIDANPQPDANSGIADGHTAAASTPSATRSGR